MICYVIESFAIVTLLTKNTFIEELRKQYVLVARAKGLSQQTVLWKHVFRNALIPLTTVSALNIGALLGGAIVTETVFSLDGIGYYYVQKLGQLDLYAVMAYLLVTSLIIIVFNLVADILYGFLDPRIRMS
jgi:microcin C transport system permease protein